MRDRGDDVILLARHFLRHLQKENERVSDFSEEALALLRQYSWPGNIRELRNAVERGLALASGNMILPNDLPASIQRAEQPPTVHAGTEVGNRNSYRHIRRRGT